MQKKTSFLLKIFVFCIFFALIFALLHTYVIIKFIEPDIFHFVKGASLPYVLYGVFGLAGAVLLLLVILYKGDFSNLREESSFSVFANVLCSVIFLSCFAFLAISFAKLFFIDSVPFAFIGFMPVLTMFFALLSGIYFLLLCLPKSSDITRAFFSLAPVIFSILLLLERLLDTETSMNSPLKNIHIVSLCAMTVYLLLESKLCTGKVLKTEQKTKKLFVSCIIFVLLCAFITFPHIMLCAFWEIVPPYSLVFDMTELALIFPALARMKDLIK